MISVNSFLHMYMYIPLPLECLLIQQVIAMNDVSRTNAMTVTTGEIIPTNSTIDNCAVVSIQWSICYYIVAIMCILSPVPLSTNNVFDIVLN